MKNFTALERFIGGIKFAIVLITLFTVAMIVGTFLESYYGTEFAGRLVYKSLPFMILQFLMGMSILYAVFLRMPFKKRLYGFYTIHAGLILIVGGSVMTYIAGIDGNVTLMPMTPVRDIKLSDDIFKMTNMETKEVTSFKLPNVAFETDLNAKNGFINLKKYLPYAEKEMQWKKSTMPSFRNTFRSSSQYFLANDNVAEEFTLSLHPEAFEIKSSLTLGPLNIHYLPGGIADCFGDKSESGVIIWNTDNQHCFSPESQNLPMKTTESGKRFIALKDNGEVYAFFPEQSPFPLDKNLKPIQNSKFRAFSRKMFEKSPHLFLFGKKVAYFDKDEELWSVHAFNGKESVELPWMGFEVRLQRHETDLIPTFVPKYVIPIQKDSKLIKGETKGLQVEINGKEYWIRNDQAITLRVGGKKYKLEIDKESLTLPYELSLTNFKMDKDPGTNNPASYESFVQLFSKDGATDHHIYMNNPLKFDGLTFYQASYFEVGPGQYGSVLSVNLDPGRPVKYFGSLLLVLGSMWHFLIRRKKSVKVAA